ncbi:MAG: ribosome silencing factor [Gemmatimonadota bacterium]
MREAEPDPSGHGAAEPDRPEEGPDLPSDVSRAAELVLDRKARDVVCLDLRGLSSATDYFLVASGTSDLHVRAIAEHTIEELKRAGVRPDHVEGLRGGRWVLIDYIDFVVHVFHPAAREFYQLERLWGDAPAHALEV